LFSHMSNPLCRSLQRRHHTELWFQSGRSAPMAAAGSAWKDLAKAAFACGTSCDGSRFTAKDAKRGASFGDVLDQDLPGLCRSKLLQTSKSLLSEREPARARARILSHFSESRRGWARSMTRRNTGTISGPRTRPHFRVSSSDWFASDNVLNPRDQLLACHS